MPIIYTVDFSDGTKTSFSISPKATDGPGEFNTHTDLSLHGENAESWGEQVNQNFVKLLENFSSPEDDLNPGNPQDSVISTPIQGQLWYNQTDTKMYKYSGTDWTASTNVSYTGMANMPTVNNDGDLLYVFDGTDALISGQTFNSARRLFVWQTNAWIPVIDNFLHRNGLDAMLANLNMGSNFVTNVTSPTVGNTSHNQYAATKLFVDNAVTTHENKNNLHLTATQNILLDELESTYAVVAKASESISTLTSTDIGQLINLRYDAEIPNGGTTNASGVTNGSVQEQIDLKVSLSGSQTITGSKTFTSDLILSYNNSIYFASAGNDPTEIYVFEPGADESHLRIRLSDNPGSDVDILDIGADSAGWVSAATISAAGNMFLSSSMQVPTTKTNTIVPASGLNIDISPGAGGELNISQNVDLASGKHINIKQDPVGNNDAARKFYVDTKITTEVSNISGGRALSQIWPETTAPAGASIGDIWVDTDAIPRRIYIHDGNGFKQVFPAVFA